MAARSPLVDNQKPNQLAMKVISKLLRLAAAVVCAGALSAQAAILVEPTGTVVETFAGPIDAANWSTLGATGNAAAYTAAATLDADIIANTSAADITAALTTSGTQPPSVSNIARRNTAATGLYIQTRPNNGVAYILLMATLQNNTG